MQPKATHCRSIHAGRHAHPANSTKGGTLVPFNSFPYRENFKQGTRRRLLSGANSRNLQMNAKNIATVGDVERLAVGAAPVQVARLNRQQNGAKVLA